MTKRFDQRYFDRWYRDSRHRVGTTADLERTVRLAVASAEHVLARPIRSVLDVGAGEGRWAPIVRRIRPRAVYHGVEPSEYAVGRYGKRRNIVSGVADDLDSLFPDRVFDLVVCCSVLNYLPGAVMTRALAALARHTRGLAYIELFTSADDVVGDTVGWCAESPARYRQLISRAGLVPCGLHCYVPRDQARSLVALERMA